MDVGRVVIMGVEDTLAGGEGEFGMMNESFFSLIIPSISV